MATRLNKPISVTLGSLAARAEARVKSGDYASISEVLREGLRALDREEGAMLELVKKRLAEMDANSRPGIPIEEAFARMDAYIAEQKVKRGL